MTLIAAAFAAAMPPLAPTIEIAPSVRMPWVVDGDLHQPNASTSYDTWFSAGGRGVDTAWSYFNQEAVGEALRRQKVVPRSEIFLQTKIECMGSVDATVKAGQHDLDLLKESYVDLLLIHAPWQGWGEPYSNCSKGPTGKAARQATWRGMEALQRAGRVRSIGVSNYNAEELAEILEIATIPPAVNQIAVCVGYVDNATVAFSRAHNITTQAYSPLGGTPWGGAPVMRLPQLQPMAQAHGKTAAQVALKWIVQQGIPFATATDNVKHILQDMDVFNWTLSNHEMAVLSSIRSAPPPIVTRAGEAPFLTV